MVDSRKGTLWMCFLGAGPWRSHFCLDNTRTIFRPISDCTTHSRDGSGKLLGVDGVVTRISDKFVCIGSLTQSADFYDGVGVRASAKKSA